MGKQKKNKDRKDKDKDKDKKKNKDRDRERKQKKKRDKKRSYSSSSSSDSSDSSSSSSQRDKNRKKQNKKKIKQKKQQKPEVKTTNNPYDFQKTVSKTVSGFPVGLSNPGFTVPIMHPTPPPPTQTIITTVVKPKTKQIHIFKLLPKLPYGVTLFAKTLYSTQHIQEKVYNKLLQQMMDQVDKKVKQENHKKGMNIITKCRGEINRLIGLDQQKMKNYYFVENNSNKEIIVQQKVDAAANNRFANLKNIYDNYFRD